MTQFFELGWANAPEAICEKETTFNIFEASKRSPTGLIGGDRDARPATHVRPRLVNLVALLYGVSLQASRVITRRQPSRSAAVAASSPQCLLNGLLALAPECDVLMVDGIASRSPVQHREHERERDRLRPLRELERDRVSRDRERQRSRERSRDRSHSGSPPRAPEHYKRRCRDFDARKRLAIDYFLAQETNKRYKILYE
ncbi:hypothetical protein MSG28_015453 [Choristoneura fumiferana]|uniref:Uncharacterized protein n=1 Tax=Choristoneura fumiferana TaxID=7141 RepID=A0ACC0KAA3_CHOFU|nr:hypothetical protein MSG28_015453 [Choristoneura fumiferana]